VDRSSTRERAERLAPTTRPPAADPRPDHYETASRRPPRHASPGVLNGRKYYYAGQRLNAGGDERSLRHRRRYAPLTRPDRPTGFALSRGTEEIQWRGTHVPGSISYAVRRSRGTDHGTNEIANPRDSYT